MDTRENFIYSVEDLLKSTEEPSIHAPFPILFRGQDTQSPLLPKIARRDPRKNTKSIEKEMLEEFRRRLAYLDKVANMDDWDLLVYAQHYGLATRLLDWTTNPLAALWFACENGDDSSDGYIYLLIAPQESFIDRKKDKSPFTIKSTKILKPKLNNERIIAQNGWFTVHRYSQQSQMFVDLEQNTSLNPKVLKKGIPGPKKEGILKALDKLGVNQESIYLGPEGTSKYINWLNSEYL